MKIVTTVSIREQLLLVDNQNRISIRQYVLTIMPYINQERVDMINLSQDYKTNFMSGLKFLKINSDFLLRQRSAISY